MKKYVLYEKSTGRILATGTSFDVKYMINADHGIIEGMTVDNVETAYVADGQIREMPSKPSIHHKWDYAKMAWFFDMGAAWDKVRRTRNELLQQSDWTQLPDVPSKTKQEWSNYRQMLRDVTSQTDPARITWPAPPSN